MEATNGGEGIIGLICLKHLMLYFYGSHHQVRVFEQIVIVSMYISSSVIVLFLFVSVSALQRKPYVMLIQLAILKLPADTFHLRIIPHIVKCRTDRLE